MPLLRHASDARTLAFVAAFFVLVALQWRVALPVAVAVPAWLATLVLAFAATVINHNVCHRPVFRAKPLNRALRVALTFIYGLPVAIFVPVHNLSHHKPASMRTTSSASPVA
jgi:fatty acid desaturase